MQQRVVLDTGQRNAVIGKNVAVKFEVLPDLFFVRVFEPGRQLRQRRIEIELLTGVRPAVFQGQIGALQWRESKRNADQFRRHRVEAGSLGIEGHELCRIQFCHPGVERFGGADRNVLFRAGFHQHHWPVIVGGSHSTWQCRL